MVMTITGARWRTGCVYRTRVSVRERKTKMSCDANYSPQVICACQCVWSQDVIRKDHRLLFSLTHATHESTSTDKCSSNNNNTYCRLFCLFISTSFCSLTQCFGHRPRICSEETLVPKRAVVPIPHWRLNRESTVHYCADCSDCCCCCCCSCQGHWRCCCC